MEQKALIQQLKKHMEQEIAEMQFKLDAAVIDDSPFLIILNDDTVQRIYGQWDTPMGKVHGFQSVELATPSLCGAHMFTTEVAKRNVQRLKEAGLSVYAKHWRTVVQERVASLRSTLNYLEDASRTLIADTRP